ncbi:MerR family DNA-binding transcriptional regulator [Enterococcus sp. OL5]|uniref:helix-turn-helix domain-containing protein n=1 Tax=Enterococcus sp. OL5 TaxID=2590214 RepID=UPI00112C9AC9|nr:MerR family transcriptional regulator [Enterococcus sp. OL5]TPR55070.1 MerR family transcriptional regulator [Enterococcus sp. OL5]
MAKYLLIKDVAKLLSIETSTIRYWEKCGLISLRRDEANGYRYFDTATFLKLVDIVFYRSIQIPVEELKYHLNEDIQTQKKILDNSKLGVLDQISKLEAISRSIDMRLDHLKSFENLGTKQDNLEIRKIPVSKIIPFSMRNKDHVNQYINDISNFFLIYSGTDFDEVTESVGLESWCNDQTGIELDNKEIVNRYFFVGVLKTDADDYKKNNINELKEKLPKNLEYNRVIAQYISHGLDNGVNIDYYYCWFI